MAGVTGREARAAYAQSSTWGVPASVTKEIFLTSTAGLQAEPALVDDENFNQDFIGQAEVGDEAPRNQDLEMQLRYEDLDVWLAAAMGSPAAPTVVSSLAANSLIAYRHVVTLAPEITDFLTLAIDIGSPSHFVHEVTTLKVRGYTIRVGDNGVMRVAFPVTGNKAVYDSTVNTNSTVAGAAAASVGNRVFRKSDTFRMNVQSAGALAAGDAISEAREIEVGYMRPVADGDHVFGQDYILEPDDDGFAEFPIRVTYARMNTVTANSLVVGLKAARSFKADLDFLGPYINSTTQRELKWEWPNLQLHGTPDLAVTGHNQVRPQAEFRAKLAVSSPTGMGFVNPFQLTIVNMNSATLLS
jgi:hypothetical protein